MINFQSGCCTPHQCSTDFNNIVNLKDHRFDHHIGPIIPSMTNSTMHSPFLSLPAEIRLQIYQHFIPPIMEVNSTEDVLNAQRLRATCRQIWKEIDREVHRRVELAIESRMGVGKYSVKVWNAKCKPKVKTNIPISVMRAEAQVSQSSGKDFDPRTTFSYRLLEATPAYVQNSYFKFVHDIEVSTLETNKYASRIIAGRVYHSLDNN